MLLVNDLLDLRAQQSVYKSLPRRLSKMIWAAAAVLRPAEWRSHLVESANLVFGATSSSFAAVDVCIEVIDPSCVG